MSGSDDAAWEDLVRRLEEVDSSRREAGEASGASKEGAAEDAASDEPAAGQAPGTTTGTGVPRAVRGFDFRVDPALGPDAVVPPLPRASGPRDWDAPDEDPFITDFTPPEPEPVLSGRPDRVLAWMCAVGAPILIVVLLIFWQPLVPALAWTVLIGASVLGWGYLLWKLPHERHNEGDDGARL